MPAESAEVVRAAVPPSSKGQPRRVAPSLKVTRPVGVPVAGGTAVTVALSVTSWPYTAGFSEETTAALAAVCGDWLATKTPVHLGHLTVLPRSLTRILRPWRQ